MNIAENSQISNRRLKDVFGKISFGLMGTGTLFDYLIHLPSNKPIMPSLRYDLPLQIGFHLGNVGITAALIIPMAVVAEYTRLRDQSEKKYFTALGKIGLYAMILSMIIANYRVENHIEQMGNDPVDLIYGLVTIPLTIAAVKFTSQLLTRSIDKKKHIIDGKVLPTDAPLIYPNQVIE